MKYIQNYIPFFLREKRIVKYRPLIYPKDTGSQIQSEDIQLGKTG